METLLDFPMVLDIEADALSPISASMHPMWPANDLVLIGTKNLRPLSTPIISRHHLPTGGTIPSYYGVCCSKLVGHNIKYDLLYMLRYGVFIESDIFKMGVWDTQLVEYLITGQQAQYASLDELSVKYGGVLKDATIKELWAKGVPTSEIPDGLLREYLKGDLSNTELIFNKQLEIVKDMGLEPLVSSQMDALIATTIMEWNGMKADVPYIEGKQRVLGVEVAAVHEALLSSIKSLWGHDIDWNLNSDKQLSAMLFGGKIKQERRVLVGKYKDGRDKYSIKVEHHVLKGCINTGAVGTKLNKLNHYSVDDAVLRNVISHKDTPHEVAMFCTGILAYRERSKQKTTYYDNLKSLVFPDSYIYPNINMTSTKTGRLSCNRPNIQNQTETGGVKRAYVSRWGVGGSIVDFDYQQLEVVALAILSNDVQLCKDLNGGVDIHTALYSEMYKCLPTTEQRKKFKRLTFGLIYGAGAKTLAENAGCPIRDAKKFIEVFYARYSGVHAYHNRMVDTAVKLRLLDKEHTPKGLPRGRYTHVSLTGRRYVFKEYDNDWKGGTSFSPTELKNWPVQGFATGDIVPHMVGQLVKMLVNSKMAGLALPIMTVHDSLVFDCHNDVLDKFKKAVYHVLGNTSEIVSTHFKIDIPLKLSVGCSVGPNWQDMTGDK